MRKKILLLLVCFVFKIILADTEQMGMLLFGVMTPMLACNGSYKKQNIYMK